MTIFSKKIARFVSHSFSSVWSAHKMHLNRKYDTRSFTAHTDGLCRCIWMALRMNDAVQNCNQVSCRTTLDRFVLWIVSVSVAIVRVLFDLIFVSFITWMVAVYVAPSSTAKIFHAVTVAHWLPTNQFSAIFICWIGSTTSWFDVWWYLFAWGISILSNSIVVKTKKAHLNSVLANSWSYLAI